MGFSSHSGRQARLEATSRQASPRPQRTEPDSSAPSQRTSSPTGSSCQCCHWGCQRGSDTQQRAGWTAPTQRPPGAGKGGRGRMRCLVYESHLLTYTHTVTCNACMCVCVCVCVCVWLSRFSHVWLFVTLWTIGHKDPLSMGFFRHEYWRRLPCPSPGDLPDPGSKPTSPVSLALASRFFTTSITWETQFAQHHLLNNLFFLHWLVVPSPPYTKLLHMAGIDF